MAAIFHMRGNPLSNAALASDHLRRAESAIWQAGPETDLAVSDLYHIIAANECHKIEFVEERCGRAARDGGLRATG